jgi:hypothetical protein
MHRLQRAKWENYETGMWKQLWYILKYIYLEELRMTIRNLCQDPGQRFIINLIFNFNGIILFRVFIFFMSAARFMELITQGTQVIFVHPHLSTAGHQNVSHSMLVGSP